jgi:hypothetical protein
MMVLLLLLLLLLLLHNQRRSLGLLGVVRSLQLLRAGPCQALCSLRWGPLAQALQI